MQPVLSQLFVHRLKAESLSPALPCTAAGKTSMLNEQRSNLAIDAIVKVSGIIALSARLQHAYATDCSPHQCSCRLVVQLEMHARPAMRACVKLLSI